MSSDAEIRVPAVGESITEVIIAEWLKAEGSWVDKDEPLVSLETDKVNVEVTAPSAGVLSQILKKADDTAEVGEIIGQIDANAQPSAGATAATHDAVDEPKAAAAATPPTPAAVAAAQPSPAASGDNAASAMPAAQRAMAQSNLRPQDVQGTGRGGRILKEDVTKAVHAATGSAVAAGGQQVKGPATVPASAPGTTPTAAAGRVDEAVPMTPMRRKIAERLVQAQHTAALLTTFNEVDMSQVMACRKTYQEQFTKKYGIKLGFMSFFVKAAVEALREFPEINAEIQGNNIVYHNYYDVGVAVGGAKGLVVPVIRNAELLNFAQVEQTISDFGKRAKEGKIKLDELQGGTFTISNGGVYGSLMSTPIVNPPQSGILGMHSIQQRPVGVDGQVVLRPMMYIALSYDHRIVDGRGAVSFLKRIKECVENPERILLEI